VECAGTSSHVPPVPAVVSRPATLFAQEKSSVVCVTGTCLFIWCSFPAYLYVSACDLEYGNVVVSG
jgi:hypothetical protein